MRLGIPISTPLAVQQWDGIIAVNYSARNFGVKRGDRVETVLSKCPQIKLVHVETISTDSVLDEEAGAAAVAAGAGAGPDKGACKVSLERYFLWLVPPGVLFGVKTRRYNHFGLAAKVFWILPGVKAPAASGAPSGEGAEGTRSGVMLTLFDRSLYVRMLNARRKLTVHVVHLLISSAS